MECRSVMENALVLGYFTVITFSFPYARTTKTYLWALQGENRMGFLEVKLTKVWVLLRLQSPEVSHSHDIPHSASRNSLKLP